MHSKHNHSILGHAASDSPKQMRSAFTLAELVVSMAVFSILAGSTITAILIATKAIPDPGSLSQQHLSARRTVNELAGELFYAVDITSSAVTSTGLSTIEFIVHDRGHGASGPETIRYAWSGTEGEPLMRQYNSGAAETVVANVDHFEVSFTHKILELGREPIVLLITDDPPSAQIDDRRALFESWGCTVTQQAATEPVATLTVAMNASDVVYITREVGNDILQLISKIGAGGNLGSAVGVVTELGIFYNVMGIASGSTLLGTSADTISIVDNTHEITAGFALGDLTICGSPQNLVETTGTVAPEMIQLATRNSSPSLGIIEPDGLLHNGSKSGGRRVKLPWGRLGFDFNALSSNGKTLLKRSLFWAAQPNVHRTANITLRLISGTEESIQQSTVILNQPRCLE